MDIGDRVKVRPAAGRNRSAGAGSAGESGAGRRWTRPRAALEQATANLQQGKRQEQLAKVTAERWKKLLAKGVVSRQENDTYQSQWAAAQANVQALEKAVAAARSNISAAEANLSRLTDLQGYKSVRAPFAGVITVRNVDVGALVTEGNTLLFRIAQTDRLRTYVNVPQSDADSVHVGQVAHLADPRSGRPPVRRHGHAHRQRARPRHAHAADRGAGAQLRRLC